MVRAQCFFKGQSTGANHQESFRDTVQWVPVLLWCVTKPAATVALHAFYSLEFFAPFLSLSLLCCSKRQAATMEAKIMIPCYCIRSPKNGGFVRITLEPTIMNSSTMEQTLPLWSLELLLRGGMATRQPWRPSRTMKKMHASLLLEAGWEQVLWRPRICTYWTFQMVESPCGGINPPSRGRLPGHVICIPRIMSRRGKKYMYFEVEMAENT